MTVYLDSRTGRYYFQFQHNGITYKEYPVTGTEKDAEIAEKCMEVMILQGRWEIVNGKKNILFDKLVEKYKEHAKNNNKAWKKEEYRVNQIAQYFKGMPIREITPAVIEEYKTKRKNTTTKRNTKRSPGTINRELALIRKCFSIAVANGWLNTNPALSCKVPLLKENNEIIRYLTDEEQETLLDSCHGDLAWLEPIILTALHTGIRRWCILNLKWKENIDIKEGWIKLTADMTKSGKEEEIPMSSTLFDRFKELFRNRIVGNDYVFVNPKTGCPYSDIRDSWIKLRKRAEIDLDFRFHDLRHHVGTKLDSKKVSPATIKRILGHSTLSVTDKYVHAKPENLRAAVRSHLVKNETKYIKI